MMTRLRISRSRTSSVAQELTPHKGIVRLALLLCMLLAACGVPATPTGTTSSATTEAATTEAAPATADAATTAPETETVATSGDTIKVGVLHSLSGTMSISEVSVRDATLMAIDEINAAGGVLGKQLEPVIEDGASDWPTFAEKAKKLIQQDQVAVVFGCWTSASRKAVLPVFESLNCLLFYPVQYEGLESSPNIFYTGAEPTPADRPGSRLPAEGRQEEDLPARLGLRVPAHRQQDHQGPACGEWRRTGGRGIYPAGRDRVQHGHQQDRGGTAGRDLQHAQRR